MSATIRSRVAVAVVALGVGACGAHDVAGDAGATPAECVAAVDQQREVECTGTARQCLYSALRPSCESGRPAFIQTVFTCLSAQGSGCPSPDDPSGAQGCVDAAVSTYATDADRALGSAICACEGTPAETGCDKELPRSLATLMFMSTSDVTALNQCIAMMGCGAIQACIAASPLATAFACGC